MKHFFCLLITTFCFPQEKLADIKFSKDSDTSYYNFNKHRALMLNAETIEHNVIDFTFRFTFDTSSITLYQYKGLAFGNVKIMVYEVDDRMTDNTFSIIFPLTAEQAKNAIALIENSKIKDLPSDKFISNWKFGFDGVTYIIEQNKEGKYSFKKYWTPTIQENLAEAKAIEQFKDNLLNITDYGILYKTFSKGIPFRCYTHNGPSIVCRPFTSKRELRRHSRLKRKNKKD